MATYASGSIRFSGLGSDTNFDDMISKLVAIEGRQVTQLMRWKSDWQTRLDAFKQVRSELMNLQTTLKGMNSLSKFLVKSTVSSDEKLVSATATSDSANVSYNIKVQQKATQSYWTKETGLYNRTDVICDTAGGGSFSYSYKGVYRTVDVPQGTTVDGLLKLINNDSKNPGVKAQIIQTVDGISFQLQGMDTGKTNTLVIRGTDKLIGLDVSLTSSNYADTQNEAVSTKEFAPGEFLIPTGGETQTFVYTVDGKRYSVDINPEDTLDDLVLAINTKTPQTPPLASKADDDGNGLFSLKLSKPNSTYDLNWNDTEGFLTNSGSGYESLTSKILAAGDTATYTMSFECVGNPSGQVYDPVTVTIDKDTTVASLTKEVQAAYGNRATVTTVMENGKYKISIVPKETEHRVTVENGSYEPLSYTPPSADGWDVVHAQNAMVKINDIPSGDKWMEMASNTLSGDEVIPGITFNIHSVTGEHGVDISVANDTEAMMENIQAFVDAVNQFRTLLASLSSYDEEKEQLDPSYAESQFEMQKGGVLMGNYGIQLVSSRLKSAIAGTSLGFLPLQKDVSGWVTGGDLFSSLSQIGITTNANQGESTYGLLEINSISGTYGSKSLEECLAEDPEAVARLFAAKGEGRSNSPDLFHYDSHVNTITKPGSYQVAYTVNADGTINESSATIGGLPCKVSGNVITCTDGAAKGLSINVIACDPGQTYNGSVSIMDGKINELLGMLEGTEGMLGSSGTLRTLEDNYQDIIDGIEDKIKREDERISRFETMMTLKFARLETVLAKYNGIQETLESQLAQLSTSNKKS